MYGSFHTVINIDYPLIKNQTNEMSKIKFLNIMNNMMYIWFAYYWGFYLQGSNTDMVLSKITMIASFFAACLGIYNGINNMLKNWEENGYPKIIKYFLKNKKDA